MDKIKQAFKPGSGNDDDNHLAATGKDEHAAGTGDSVKDSARVPDPNKAEDLPKETNAARVPEKK